MELSTESLTEEVQHSERRGLHRVRWRDDFCLRWIFVNNESISQQ